jgi:hypothetical protein
LETEWQHFVKFLNEFFDGNKNTTLTGGRYGCAQYSIHSNPSPLVKLFGPKPLQECSLGRLTLFVQMAVNKGIIRYNKTFLIKNQQ